VNIQGTLRTTKTNKKHTHTQKSGNIQGTFGFNQGTFGINEEISRERKELLRN
jgi:hypothetical protein